MKEIGWVIFFFVFFIISSLCARYEITKFYNKGIWILPFIASIFYGALFIFSLINL